MPNVSVPEAREVIELDLAAKGSKLLRGGASLAWKAGELRIKLGDRPAQWQFQGSRAQLYLDVPMACCSESVIDPATWDPIVPQEEGWRLEINFDSQTDETSELPWLLQIDGAAYLRTGARSTSPLLR